jgi:hypothetical protein
MRSFLSKPNYSTVIGFLFGSEEETRTPNPRFTEPPLYQL